MEERGHFLVVAKLEVRYLGAARYDDLLTLHTQLRRITRARIEHEYVLNRAEVVLCQGSSSTYSCSMRARVILRNWVRSASRSSYRAAAR